MSLGHDVSKELTSPSPVPSLDASVTPGQSIRWSARSTSLTFLERVLTRRRSSLKSTLDVHGKLGLNLLSCPSDPLLDLVFVHGLGGGSIKTWCHSKDATRFWPKEWLPRESGFHNVRIHSYGYDADWTSTKASPTINVHDFGQQLLERLRNSPEISNSRPKPIIFVAHSLGGLVVKQAYVLARQDPSCSDLAKRVEAMYFLGTPHRGSNLAQTLNGILRASGTIAPRSYISNLSQQNELLSSLNDSFQRYAPDVSLYSFWESQATDLYIRSEMIVTKDSAILGYSHERHAMLDADHRNICKFEAPSDPNYIAIRGALRSIIDDISERLSAEDDQQAWRAMQQIESYLAMPARPDDDLGELEESRFKGSCEWLAEKDTFQRWADPGSKETSMVYWISGNPGTGKSVLSGYAINTLTNLSVDCNKYFFRHGDKDKSTLSGFLRSLLYQMALRSADVRQQLLSMIEKAVRFNKDDSMAIWRKIVRPIISHTSTSTVHYWVLDALDECSEFELLFKMMASLERKPCIRILITSRPLPEISQQFANLQRNQTTILVHAEEIAVDDSKVDIGLYLEGNRHKFHVGDDSQKDAFINHVLDKSEGCFLWVRLVLDELASAWSIRDVQRILDEMPQGMDPLYSRALNIMSSRSKPNRDLIRAILTWAVCSARPLTMSELREALKLDLDAEVPELEMAIASLCAQLIHVDKSGRVLIVHLTAKTFLTDEALDSEFHVNMEFGHLRLATNCLQFLCSDGMKLPRTRPPKRQQIQALPRSPFAGYACLNFAEHLRRITSGSEVVSTKLYSFLETNVLAWIEFVASAGSLTILTRTAISINAYLQRHIRSPSSLENFVYLTQNWVIDLNRIVAGFGQTLLACPSAIYWLIPPFCPKSSAIAATAACRFNRITVRGIKDEGWDDRVSCIDTHDTPASAVACGEAIFAVGYSVGSISLYHNGTCLPWKTLEHGSPVRHLLFNANDTHIFSVGRRDIRVWEIESGAVLWASKVSRDVMNLDITEDGKVVMVTDKSHTFTSWEMQSGELKQKLIWAENMPFQDEIGFRRPPITAALSPDSSLIAIVYRGRPICLYDLDDDSLYGLVSREEDPTTQGLGSNTSPVSLVFNTKKDSCTFVAAYEEGDLCLFDYEELTLLKTIETNAHTVACSPDGLTLVTGNSFGTVQLWEFDTLKLLYQVNAADYSIRGIAFSADNLRFVDVRGTQCNVWEPAVLVGMVKRDASSTEQVGSGPVIKGIDSEEIEITTMELESSGRFFFVGRSDGSVSINDTSSGERRKVLYRHKYQVSVTTTTWGSQRHIITSSDTACRFIVFRLLPDEEFGWKAAARLMDRRGDSIVLQLLLDPSNDLLLVSTEKSNSVWDIEAKTLISTKTWQTPPSFSWLNHPRSPEHRTLVTADRVVVCDWKSSSEFMSTTLFQAPGNYAPSETSCVGNVFTFAHDKLLAVELSQPYGDRSTTDAIVFALIPFDSEDGFLTPAAEFDGLGRTAKYVIGGYSSRLLFVDASFWVCSVDASQGGSKYYVRHFPIPSDWMSQQRRLNMAVTRNGDVLFARVNEVAIISRGLGFEERVQLESR